MGAKETILYGTGREEIRRPKTAAGRAWYEQLMNGTEGAGNQAGSGSTGSGLNTLLYGTEGQPPPRTQQSPQVPSSARSGWDTLLYGEKGAPASSSKPQSQDRPQSNPAKKDNKKSPGVLGTGVGLGTIALDAWRGHPDKKAQYNQALETARRRLEEESTVEAELEPDEVEQKLQELKWLKQLPPSANFDDAEVRAIRARIAQLPPERQAAAAQKELENIAARNIGVRQAKKNAQEAAAILARLGQRPINTADWRGDPDATLDAIRRELPPEISDSRFGYAASETVSAIGAGLVRFFTGKVVSTSFDRETNPDGTTKLKISGDFQHDDNIIITPTGIQILDVDANPDIRTLTWDQVANLEIGVEGIRLLRRFDESRARSGKPPILSDAFGTLVIKAAGRGDEGGQTLAAIPLPKPNAFREVLETVRDLHNTKQGANGARIIEGLTPRDFLHVPQEDTPTGRGRTLVEMNKQLEELVRLQREQLAAQNAALQATNAADVMRETRDTYNEGMRHAAGVLKPQFDQMREENERLKEGLRRAREQMRRMALGSGKDQEE